MNDISIALSISFLLTILLAFIQIAIDAKIYELRYFSLSLFIIYIIMMGLGNLATTFMASGIIGDEELQRFQLRQIDGRLPKGPHWFWFSFMGVFGFEVLIKRINVSFYGKGVITINDWIVKTKSATVAATLRRKSDRKVIETQRWATRMFERYRDNIKQIHTIAHANLGATEYSMVIKNLETTSNIDAELKMCFILAERFPLVVRGCLIR